MSAHYGGGVGGVFNAGLRAMSAFGRITEDTEEDEEAFRRRIQAEENRKSHDGSAGRKPENPCGSRQIVVFQRGS